MVPSGRQRPTPSWTEEAILFLFREVLHSRGTRFFQHVKNNVRLVGGAWHDGGGGERHQQKVLKLKIKDKS